MPTTGQNQTALHPSAATQTEERENGAEHPRRSKAGDILGSNTAIGLERATVSERITAAQESKVKAVYPKQGSKPN